MIDKVCVVCGAEALHQCGGCRAVDYCSKVHQKLHWNEHKHNCHPFHVVWDPMIGHHLVASRNIQPCEIILREIPWVVGPSMVEGPAICVGCSYPLGGKSMPCPTCRWPMCGRKECWAVGSQHSLGECSMLVGRVTENFAAKVTREVYPSIMYLRYLGLKKRDPAKWEQLLNLQYCGPAEQLKWQETRDHTKIIQLVNNWVPNDDSVTTKSIVKLCAVSACNSIDLPALPSTRNYGLHGIYPLGSLIPHSCLANAAKTFNKSGKFIVKAALPITKGSRITLNYSKALFGTMKRRYHLEQTKFGSCSCERCSDPTELGTFTSGIYCLHCPKQTGILLPEHPLNKETNWLCNQCADRQPAAVINSKLELIQKNFNSLIRLSVSELEALISKYNKILHPHHYLLCEAKWTLIHSYGELEKKAGQFAKKEVITRELLGIMDVISPGMHRVRGILLYHLFCVLTNQGSKMGRDKRNHTPSIALPFNKLTETILREACEIVSWGKEETAEMDEARKYAEILKSVELQVKYWEVQKLMADVKF